MVCLFPDFECCKLNTTNFLFLQLPRHFWKCLGIWGKSRNFRKCLEPTKVIAWKTQTHAVNIRWKRLSQLSLSNTFFLKTRLLSQLSQFAALADLRQIWSQHFTISSSISFSRSMCLFHIRLWILQWWCKGYGFFQGILSVPGIAGYEWVPARIGPFYKEIFFHNTNVRLKTWKTGTHSSADTSPVQCSLIFL